MEAVVMKLLCVLLIVSRLMVTYGKAIGHLDPQLLLKTSGNTAELYNSNGGSWLQALLLFTRGDPTVAHTNESTIKFESVLNPEYKATMRCPNEFTTLGEHCYYFSLNIAKWHVAQQLCHELGSELAHPASLAENALLVNYLRNHYKGSLAWFIGGTDEDKEGEFVWAHSKAPIVFTDWIPGHPNNYGNNEHCVDYLENYEWRWNDTPCNNTIRYICQI